MQFLFIYNFKYVLLLSFGKMIPEYLEWGTFGWKYILLFGRVKLLGLSACH